MTDPTAELLGYIASARARVEALAGELTAARSDLDALIREARRLGVSQRIIAEELGVSREVIRRASKRVEAGA